VIYRDVHTQQKERKIFAMFRAVQLKFYLLQYISLVWFGSHTKEYSYPLMPQDLRGYHDYGVIA
jgi:hypothetical protein